MRARNDARFDRLVEAGSQARARVELAKRVSVRQVQRARRQAAVVVPVIVAVLVAFSDRRRLFGHGVDTPVRVATTLALVVLGWALARDIGRAAAPSFYRRMDPGTAGTLGFLLRLATMSATVLLALWVAGLRPATIAMGGAFTAVVLGLAAQQTLGNLIAGIVLLSARPFRVGERVRLQAGALGGRTEGVVSTLGLLYTTLARGEDLIMVPNSVVLSAAVVPIREPDSVDALVHLRNGISPTVIQAALDERISTPVRAPARVLLEEVDGQVLTVRIQATPERGGDGAALADEVIAALRTLTGEHRNGPDARG